MGILCVECAYLHKYEIIFLSEDFLYEGIGVVFILWYSELSVRWFCQFCSVCTATLWEVLERCTHSMGTGENCIPMSFSFDCQASKKRLFYFWNIQIVWRNDLQDSISFPFRSSLTKRYCKIGNLIHAPTLLSIYCKLHVVSITHKMVTFVCIF